MNSAFNVKNILVLVLIISLCSAALAAEDAAWLDGEDISIAFIIADLSDEACVELMAACGSEAEKYGAVFSFVEAMEASVQIETVKSCAWAGIDVIICQVSDSEAMQLCVEEAQARGVRFIAYDTDVKNSDMFFGIRDFDLGYSAAENACNWIRDTFAADETVKVGIGNYPDFAFLAEREAGIRAGFAQLCPNAEIVDAQQAGFELEGMEAGEVWIRSEAGLNCIVGINDSGIIGIYRAFEMGGVDVSGRNARLGFFGCGADAGAMELIDKHTAFRGTVALDLVGAADDFIKSAIILANGGQVEHDYMLEVIPITDSD